MIPVGDIYNSVALDTVNSAENGDLSFSMFNRMSRLGELRLLDYISGDIEDLKPPAPYTSQKIKDYLSDFITKYPKNVEDGLIIRPDDYYGFENIYMIGDFSKTSTCDEGIDDEGTCDTPIELVDGSEFKQRCQSYIRGLRPTFSKPITKMVGKTFEFMPKDIGSVVLEYIRYPKYAQIVSKQDLIYNDLVVDEDLSINYEYGDWAKELLVYFITRQFSTSTREDNLLQRTQVTAKLVRDEK